MTAVVIDTNVLLVANGSHQGISLACRAVCIAALHARQKSGVVAIDDAYRILREYHKKTQPNQPKGVGDVFLKWLMQNVANELRVHRITITETGPDHFEEFPDPALQAEFDAPDRKFAAVAHAHRDKPPIWQAADSKWLNWWPQLRSCGVEVKFLCPADVLSFHKASFPDRPVPELPMEA